MAKQNHKETQFLEDFGRVLSMWPAGDAERVANLSREYRNLFLLIGPTRFKTAVDDIIAVRNDKFFPTVGEFRQYVPQVAREGWSPTAQDYADRRAHPDEYFGTADVIVAMRAHATRMAGDKKLYSHEELLEIIARARKKHAKDYKERYKV